MMTVFWDLMPCSSADLTDVSEVLTTSIIRAIITQKNRTVIFNMFIAQRLGLFFEQGPKGSLIILPSGPYSIIYAVATRWLSGAPRGGESQTFPLE
jgi:hypothetical protein